jgi:hypothetical protein
MWRQIKTQRDAAARRNNTGYGEFGQAVEEDGGGSASTSPSKPGDWTTTTETQPRYWNHKRQRPAKRTEEPVAMF